MKGNASCVTERSQQSKILITIPQLPISNFNFNFNFNFHSSKLTE
jgi:hypothetical protein